MGGEVRAVPGGLPPGGPCLILRVEALDGPRGYQAGLNEAAVDGIQLGPEPGVPGTRPMAGQPLPGAHDSPPGRARSPWRFRFGDGWSPAGQCAAW